MQSSIIVGENSGSSSSRHNNACRTKLDFGARMWVIASAVCSDVYIGMGCMQTVN